MRSSTTVYPDIFLGNIVIMLKLGHHYGTMDGTWDHLQEWDMKEESVACVVVATQLKIGTNPKE